MVVLLMRAYVRAKTSKREARETRTREIPTLRLPETDGVQLRGLSLAHLDLLMPPDVTLTRGEIDTF